MFNHIIEFVYNEGDKICRFLVDNNTDIQVVERALLDFLQRTGAIKQQGIDQQKAQAGEQGGEGQMDSGDAYEERSLTSGTESA